MQVIYLDNNATTKPAEPVVEAMCAALREHWANPSSGHRLGQAAKQQMELARESVANLINAKDRDIVFTSGGTEAANFAIAGSLMQQPDRNVIVTSRLEHTAVRECADTLERRGAEVIWLPNDINGVVDVDALRDVLKKRAGEIAIVSIMAANNETGVMQPIEEIGTLCREHEVRYHSDGVQWVGKMPMDVESMPVDLLSFSAHKFHGPKGVGGLYMRRGIRLERQTIGGPHERERRGGTENVPGIVGMGVAAQRAAQWLETDERNTRHLWRDEFERTLTEALDDVSINSGGAARVWNTSNVAFSKLQSEIVLLMLSERGVCASAGSACSSGSIDASPVLMALGIPNDAAHGSVRFSICRETTRDELDQAAQIITEVVGKLRKSMSVV